MRKKEIHKIGRRVGEWVGSHEELVEEHEEALYELIEAASLDQLETDIDGVKSQLVKSMERTLEQHEH